MYFFESDYVNGCLPQVLEALVATNDDNTVGYGCDPYCAKAAALIKEACKAPTANVHFLVGGTQTNTTVIAAALRPHQGVLCAQSGHINVHETGAIEATGHKVLPLPAVNGKITAAQIEEAWQAHWNNESHEHVVQPGMVYLSQSTEVGTLYSLAELEEISRVCRQRELFLFVDGARLGYALATPECDVTLADLARLTDAFYIGGTKCGLLFGEAVVITHPALNLDFRYFIKQHGGMLAKGRLLGIQFGALFQNDLYVSACRRGVSCAQKLRDLFSELDIPLFAQSPTNQVFPILTKAEIAALRQRHGFEHWAHVDEQHDAVRFCTSWSTTDEAIEALLSDLRALRGR